MSTLIRRATQRLRQQGGRMTAQRRLILETLEGVAGEHPTAEELHQRAKAQDPSLHLSTVYRTLRWLQAEGLVSSRWFRDERRQERFDPNRPSDHHHFVCLECQQVIEFVEPLMTDGILTQFEGRTGARVESASLVLYGHCPACQPTPPGGALAIERQTQTD